jgi:hypothetical protein
LNGQVQSTTVHVQKFDWLKDLTPEEEAMVKEKEWDTEGVSLGPVEDRYKQPALNVSNEDHGRAIASAQEASRLAKTFEAGNQVRAVQAPIVGCVFALGAAQFAAAACRGCPLLLVLLGAMFLQSGGKWLVFRRVALSNTALSCSTPQIADEMRCAAHWGAAARGGGRI